MNGHATTRSYPDFPTISDALGYNPARFLATRSPSGKDTGIGQTPELLTAQAVIKGIDDRWELAWWAYVERRTRDRDHVLHYLRRRDVAIVDPEIRPWRNADDEYVAETGARYPWQPVDAGDEPEAEAQDQDQDGVDEGAADGRPSRTRVEAEPDETPDEEDPDPHVCSTHGVECTLEEVGDKAAWFCSACADFVERADEIDQDETADDRQVVAA